MTTDGFSVDRLNRILTAVETNEESLGVLARKQRLSRDEYKSDSDTRDIVERRFVRMTEASIDIGEELVKHERGHPPASNPESMRALGEIGVLSSTLAEEMAQGACFRNVLSHSSTMRCKIWSAIDCLSKRSVTTSIPSARLTTDFGVDVNEAPSGIVATTLVYESSVS